MDFTRISQGIITGVELSSFALALCEALSAQRYTDG
jgi:hypothetical protein